jgi:hypothetical protein
LLKALSGLLETALRVLLKLMLVFLGAFAALVVAVTWKN